jgi:hypothetical protein
VVIWIEKEESRDKCPRIGARMVGETWEEVCPVFGRWVSGRFLSRNVVETSCRSGGETAMNLAISLIMLSLLVLNQGAA